MVGHEHEMRLRLATWNVNSVRLRAEQVQRLVAEQAPDILCLQEIKCRDGEFPVEALRAVGLPHVKIAGQKGWHGVAIASRLPIEDVRPLDPCRRGEARCVSARVAGVEIHTVYVPAGGDTPDREANPKFDHKLDFLERLSVGLEGRDRRRPLALLGDFNVAPGEFDVWSHRQMSRIVSHTPIEVAAIECLRRALDFVDPVRLAVPDPQKLFSWWSYRARDFRLSGRGLRLDHLWLSPGAATGLGEPARAFILEEARGWERPSDHAPVLADLMV